VLYLHVSREQRRRALLIGQALVAEAERRGYEIQPIEKSYNHRAGIALVVRGHAYAFEIVEMTDRLSMTEAELKRWRRDNRYRLSYRPELEPSLKQVPNARLKLSKQRSASLAEGVFVADIAAMERCPLVRTCDQRGRASAGPRRDCLRPCSSRLGRPGIALGVPVLSSCRTAWLSQFGGRTTRLVAVGLSGRAVVASFAGAAFGWRLETALRVVVVV
jgi:hypothetical protein